MHKKVRRASRAPALTAPHTEKLEGHVFLWASTMQKQNAQIMWASPCAKSCYWGKVMSEKSNLEKDSKKSLLPSESMQNERFLT